MDLGLSGRTAAVAGASAGLGLASAQALAAEGVTVAICGRDRGRIEAAAGAVGGNAVPIVADAEHPRRRPRVRRGRHRRPGPASTSSCPTPGGPPTGTFASTPLDAYLPALQLNLLSTVAMCQAAVPAMVDRGWGRVVAITSASVRQPLPSLILSNTARAGVTGFLKTLSLEVAAEGVTVNSVQPGLHATDRLQHLYGDDTSAAAKDVPTRTVGRPEDFGAVVAFLCSDAARFVTGTALPVDGGNTRGLQ